MHDVLSVRETFRGKRLFITGVTGFLGKVWVALLLEHAPEVERIAVLVRGRRGEPARARLRRIVESSPVFRALRKKHGPALRALVDAKVEVIEGDVSAPLCGLTPRAADALAARLDLVVHFAGLTDFEPDPAQALAINVRGGTNVADLCARMAVRRMIHVSTCYVAGNVSGQVPESLASGTAPSGCAFDPGAELEALAALCDAHDTKSARIREANARAADLGWPNIYTYTKGLGEHLLAARDDLQLTLVRPSIVEGATRFPFAGWNEGINTSGPLAWLLSTTFRRFPCNPNHRFDVVPVDVVARGTALAAAAALRDEAAPVYQLASSDTNPFTFGRAVDLTALGARRIHKKDGARPFERWVVRHLDAVPSAPESQRLPIARQRELAQKARDFVRKADASRFVPRAMWDSFGERIDARRKALSQDLRNLDRKLGRVEDMLRLYKPFIHDNDYVFETAAVCALSARLPEAERVAFGWDIDALDWRHYWLDVHMPGLEQWSFPLMRGDKAPLDAPTRLWDEAPAAPAAGHGAREALRERSARAMRARTVTSGGLANAVPVSAHDPFAVSDPAPAAVTASADSEMGA